MEVKTLLHSLLFLIEYSIGAKIFDPLCDRIFFKQPYYESTLASKEIINGVFIKSDIVVDSFPVYIHERKSVYFQYSRSKNWFYFSHPKQGLSFYNGIHGYGDSYKMLSPTRWIGNTAVKKVNIFENLIKNWYQMHFEPAKVGTYLLKEKLVAQCVNFTDCQFNELAFTQKNHSGFVVDIFKPLDNVYNSYRQVYIHYRSKLYLYFSKNFWNIGDNYTSSLVMWYVNDQALKPEFITSTWKRWSGKKWEPQHGSLVECNGGNQTCGDLNCTNGGTCNTNRFNNSLCTCPFDYRSKSCQDKINETCPRSPHTKFSHLQGAIDSIFCSSGSFYNVICKKGSDNKLGWSSNDKCKLLPTRAPTRAPTTRRRIIYRRRTVYRRRIIPPLPNYRRRAYPTIRYYRRRRTTKKIFDATWVMVVVIVISCTVPIFGPMLLCYFCKRGRYGRIHSIWYWISMWLYIIYIAIVYSLNLHQYGPILLKVMDWISFGSLIYFYIYIIIESYFSEELEYVSGNLEGENSDVYLNKLIIETPSVSVDINCYHYETRTRVVTYTDANGNTQSRTENYQEMVVTHTDSKCFPFKSWRDATDRNTMPVLKNKSMRIKLYKNLLFENDETENKFLRFKEEQRSANEHRDLYIDVGVEIHIDGFKDRIMASKKGLPCWMSPGNFHLAHVIGLGWPYRWLIKNRTDKAEFTILKEISIFENAFSSVNGSAEASPVNIMANPPMTAVYYNKASDTVHNANGTGDNMPADQPPYNEPPPPYSEHSQYPSKDANGYAD